MSDDDPDLSENFKIDAQGSPVYTDAAAVDHLYDMVLRLAQELAVSREELNGLRELLRRREIISVDEAQLLSEDKQFASEQIEQHQALIRRVLGELPD